MSHDVLKTLFEGTFAETATIVRDEKNPERARRVVQRRTDEMFAMARRAGSPIACAAGCAMCCYLRVVASPTEVFGLLDYLQKSLSSDGWTAFVARVDAAAQSRRGMTHAEQVATNLACPVLVGARCSGYAARPLRCRTYHSLDVASCQYMYDHPEDDKPGPIDQRLKNTTDALRDGFQVGLIASGLDNRVYELAGALHEAISDPLARERHLRGEQTFLTADFEALEVPQ